jgi:hypothetical protein
VTTTCLRKSKHIRFTALTFFPRCVAALIHRSRPSLPFLRSLAITFHYPSITSRPKQTGITRGRSEAAARIARLFAIFFEATSFFLFRPFALGQDTWGTYTHVRVRVCLRMPMCVRTYARIHRHTYNPP